jgi:enterochelin esterase-like enzyme
MSAPNFEEHQVSSAKHPFARKVWMQKSPFGNPRAAVIFLDGELFVMGVKAPEVVFDLQAAQSIPPVLAVYVTNESAAARHTDFTCNREYASFIAQEVLPWMFSRFPDISRKNVVISGLSLSGLCAAFVAVHFPDCFRAAICQSPSFWWEKERFKNALSPAGAVRPALWVSVGDKETDKGVSHAPSGMLQESTQIEACERTCAALSNHGYPVLYQTFNGGHDPQCWREDLKRAIPWAFLVPTNHLPASPK